MDASDVLALIKAESRRFYVYLLCRPDGTPFYVGVGTGRRLLDHAIFARRPSLDSHKLRVIRALWCRGEDIRYEIAAWFEDRGRAEMREAEIIAQIGRRDLRTGPLTNVTAGGEGAPSPGDEVLTRRSESLRAAWARRDTRDKARAVAHLQTPQVRARAAASRRLGKKRGPYNWTRTPGPKGDARARLSAALKASPLPHRPGVAVKIAAANTGKTWSIDPDTGRRVYKDREPES